MRLLVILCVALLNHCSAIVNPDPDSLKRRDGGDVNASDAVDLPEGEDIADPHTEDAMGIPDDGIEEDMETDWPGEEDSWEAIEEDRPEDIVEEEGPYCGNGEIEGEEECDDGRDGDPDDGCTDECQYSCHNDDECDNGHDCTDDICDTTSTHTCSYPLSANTRLCRPSVGECDEEEKCTGSHADCPPDDFRPDTIVCRVSGGDCDVEEYCTGFTPMCPIDRFLPASIVCREFAGACDIEEHCSGTTATCPTDQYLPDTIVCRVAEGDCDLEEYCSGATPTCPVDRFFPGTTLCRSAEGPCDVVEYCTGSSGLCPTNGFLLSTEVCRAFAGDCDVEEKCTGFSEDCPSDEFAPAETSCNDGIYCTNPDACDGMGNCTGTPLSFLYGVSAIEAGGFHTCALTISADVNCWGYNGVGELGDGTTTDRHTPIDVTGLSSGVSAVAAGYFHTCALLISGGLKCWGKNLNGQLGDGTNVERHTPVDVSGLTSGVSGVEAGSIYTCALMITGGIKCWGYNSHGNLGDGTTTQRITPVDVSGLTSGVSAISAGGIHTCALTTLGGVKCWGYNNAGQLGDGTTTQRLTPVDVSGLTSGVSAVSAGYYHTCALTTSGGAKCWGANGAGNLGDGTTTHRSTPVDVSGLTSGVSAISAGDNHTCALTTSGGVKCWGYNDNGQLGDGTTTQRLTPVDVSGLTSGVSAVSAGHSHTCALMIAGGVKCWGYNYEGQLGDGTTTLRLTPVDVACN